MRNAECGMQNDKMTDEEVMGKLLDAFEWLEKIKGSNSLDENYINADIIQKFINCYQKEINRRKAEVTFLRAEYIAELEKALKDVDKLGMDLTLENARLKEEIERYKGVIKILENDVKGARESAVKEFAHMIIDKDESGGVIHVSDIPDYVVDFLKEDKDED